VHAALVKPVTRQTILTNLLLARSNFKYEKRLQTKISRLEETLRVFRKVEQAKLILMRQRTIGENEAYEYLRRQAMNKRVSVATVASAIVDANALLK
jgi:AmiR/NasT family two-component response regulator